MLASGYAFMNLMSRLGGGIIYEMLTQTLPYKIDKVGLRGAKSINEWQYHSFRQLRPDLPFWLDLAIEKACHPNYKNRHEAYSELWQDLLKPNQTLIRQYKKRPLLAQNSSRVWQIISILLLMIVMIQAYFLSTT